MFDHRKGRKFVKWFGLLADWEMSKPIYEKPSVTTQDRVVTGIVHPRAQRRTRWAEIR